MPCEAPVTMTVFCLLAISASSAVGWDQRRCSPGVCAHHYLQAKSRFLRQFGPCLLRRDVWWVPVWPVRITQSVVLSLALLVLAMGGCRTTHRARQIVC